MSQVSHEWVVRKRDGRSAPFEAIRIHDAITNAFRAELNLAAGKTLSPETPAEATEAFVRERQPDCFSYQDWCRLDELEIGMGEPQGRPRVKYTDVAKMLEAIGR